MANKIDVEKLDRLTKLLNAAETLNKFPTQYNDLNAKIMDEAKQLGRELGADVDKTTPIGGGMKPDNPADTDVSQPNRRASP